jgi:SOS-response transcriptional repressor LexA
MEPDYPDGSYVFVQRVNTDSLQYGDIVACMVSGVPYVKVYKKDGLHSINPAYGVIHISDDDNARIFGRVVGLVPEGDLATKAETAELLEVFADEIN